MPPSSTRCRRRTTHALVERAQQGDHEAYERLFGRVADELLVYIRIRLGKELRGRLDPVDVLQETYLHAHQGFEGFDPRDEGAFRRWIHRIADHRIHNLADHHGALKRRPPGGEVQGSRVLDRVRTQQSRPSTQCAKRESKARLVAAVELLDPDAREAVLLRHFQGLSVEDVGKALGKSKATVLRLLGRSRLALARLLGEP
jgi:RNA polymerase sigma-70 factor (ECF subfamily)